MCQCGCGKTTTIATRTRRDLGYVKGEPLLYVLGHGARQNIGWVKEDRGFKTPCWIWQGSLHTGYGSYWPVGGPRSIPAHVWVYEQRVGFVPEGLELDHLCRVRSCVNPDHLEPVTHAENIRRRVDLNMDMETAAAIRSADGSQRDLAIQFGVSQTQVGRIRRGERWVV